MSVDGGDGEYPSVNCEKRIRARKEHKCSACKEKIERGHIYVKHTIIYEGSVDWVLRCLRCDAIYEQLCDIHREGRRKGEHDDFPDWELDCGHEFKERWGKEPPPELARLAFATPAELQAEALAKMAVAS